MSAARDRLSVVLLAGGVGGAKMAEGFHHCDRCDLTVISNVADDDEFHGLWVSPDTDTMLYTLSDRIDLNQGWGVKDEGKRALSVLDELGQPTWMTLGDRDLGLHIYRTNSLSQGIGRQDICDNICKAFGLETRIILPTEDVIQTQIKTDDGWLSFQEYFVRERCQPEVREIAIRDIGLANPNPAAVEALSAADLVVIAPSNPLVSIEPILGIGNIREIVKKLATPVVAVSPLVGGKVVKGPLDRMMQARGMDVSTEAIASLYKGLIDILVVDHQDFHQTYCEAAPGIKIEAAPTLLKNKSDKINLANQLIDLALKSDGGDVLYG